MKTPASTSGDARRRMIFRWLLGIFFIVAGINHFVMSGFYEAIVPPGFPSPKILVVISGLAEIAGGVGVLVRSLRRAAGWGLIALLVAIYPANIYMALHPEHFNVAFWILWARLPFQLVFFCWVWWSTLSGKPSDAVQHAFDAADRAKTD
jgi:uncharacterized membrane protein